MREEAYGSKLNKKRLILKKYMEYKYHIFSPYRVCPLGAHVDHQHGLVTGFAIDKGVDLWFNVNEEDPLNPPVNGEERRLGHVHLESRTFEGVVDFEIDKPSQVPVVPSMRLGSVLN